MSVPLRRIAARPIGTLSSPSGYGPLPSRYSFFGSRIRTGSGSATAEARSPLMSAGVDGTSTLSPGTWA